MTESLAEEFRVNGNKAYAEKKYEEAIALYTQAIENDPTNFIYFSNRAAAHHELKNYDEAIRDAKKSISIQDNVKAHVRIATALWAQRKLEEARAEYKVALSLDADNQGVKNSLRILEELLEAKRSVHHTSSPRSSASSGANVMMNGVPLPPPCGGEFTSAPITDGGAAIAVAVFVVNLLFTLSCLLRPRMTIFFWRSLLCVLIAQQGLNLYTRKLIPRNIDGLKSMTQHLSALLLLTCAAALLLKIPPQHFIGVFTFLYNLVELLHHRTKILNWAGPFQAALSFYLNSLEAYRYDLLMIAASFETMTTFPIMLTSGTLFTLVYIQYIKTRYVHDRYVQSAFGNLRQKITKFMTASFMPPVLNVYAQKFFDYLHLMSQQAF